MGFTEIEEKIRVVDKITNISLLSNIAMFDEDEEIKIQAMKRLKNKKALLKVLLKEKNNDIRNIIVGLIYDLEK
jgi:hypothetical protein